VFKFTILQFASLATSGANTAVVENGVSSVEMCVLSYHELNEMYGYSAKGISRGI